MAGHAQGDRSRKLRKNMLYFIVIISMQELALGRLREAMEGEKCSALEGLEERLRQQQTQLLRQLESQLKQQLTETQGRLTVSYIILLLTHSYSGS